MVFLLLSWDDFLCENYAETFGKHKIPGFGPPVDPNISLRTGKCGGKEMSIGSTGEGKQEFLSIATEMESLLVNE